MSTYENAPTTKLLATACACCAKPLVDAKSVETGVGPECRKKHGFDKPDVLVDLAAACEIAAALPTEVASEVMTGAATTREIANRIVYRIAAEQEGKTVPALTSTLHALGFAKLAARIAKRITAISVEIAGSEVILTSPFSPEFIAASRSIPGRRWDGVTKTTRFPLSGICAVLTALSAVHGPYAAIALPEGPVTLGDAIERFVNAAAQGELPAPAPEADKGPVVKIAREGNILVVRAPYSAALTEDFRAIKGRRWDADRKVNTFPATAADTLRSVLVKHFSGQRAIGPKGEFVIGQAAAA